MTFVKRVVRQRWSQEGTWQHVLSARVAELTTLWGVPGAAHTIIVQFSPRLTRSLGRADSISGRISLASCLQSDPVLLDHALCHELAHLVAFRRVGQSERVHGPTWQALMRLAGYEPVLRLAMPSVSTSKTKAIRERRYRHRCPICQATRIAARRMPAWRCADCVAAGLDGRLDIEAVG